jgi:hypothetical protein
MLSPWRSKRSGVDHTAARNDAKLEIVEERQFHVYSLEPLMTWKAGGSQQTIVAPLMGHCKPRDRIFSGSPHWYNALAGFAVITRDVEGSACFSSRFEVCSLK